MKKLIQFVLLIAIFPSIAISQWEEIAPYGKRVDGAFQFVIDGIAYVGGGVGQEGVSSTFQSYNPETGVWTDLAALPNGPRAWAFGFEANGKGYFGGGDEKGDLSAVRKDFWEYDPETNTWAKKKDFPGGERDGCYAFSVNGIGFVGAGFDGQFVNQDGYKYNPMTDSWTAIANIPEAMIFPISFVINGSVYVGAGGQGFDKQLKTLYKYDVNSDFWTPVAVFPDEARQAASVFVYKDVAYLCGGMMSYQKNYSDVYTYEPKTNQWAKMENMTLPNDKTAWSIAFSISDVAYFGTGVDFATFSQTNKMFKYEFVKKLKPIISVNPQSYNFDNVLVGESETTQIWIKNIGDTTLTISELNFDETERIFDLPDTFAEMLPINIEPADSVFIEIIFTPEIEKYYSDVLYITSNDKTKEIVSVFLEGNGYSLEPSISLSISEIDFGILTENQDTENCFDLSNDGEGSLIIQNIELEYKTVGFMLDDSHNFPATISANSNIDYCLSFESDKAGKYSDNLVITSNDPNIGIIKIPIAAEVKEPTSSVIDFSDTDEFTLSVESNINDLVVSLTSENELLSGRLSVHDINGLRLYEKSLSNDKSETIILDAKNIGKTIFITYLHNGITYTYKHINI